MNSTTAKRRFRTLSLALAAVLAWSWSDTSTASPGDGPATKSVMVTGDSRVTRGHDAGAAKSPMLASTGTVVADDDTEGPPHGPSTWIPAWSSFGSIWGLSPQDSGTTRPHREPHTPRGPLNLRC